jgi:proteasome lid subunit RPN8/RPN11
MMTESRKKEDLKYILTKKPHANLYDKMIEEQHYDLHELLTEPYVSSLTEQPYIIPKKLEGYVPVVQPAEPSYEQITDEFRRTHDSNTLMLALVKVIEMKDLLVADLKCEEPDFADDVEEIIKKHAAESFKSGLEVGGVILKMKDGSIVEHNFNVGTSESVRTVDLSFPNDLPSGVEVVINYHTHPSGANFPSTQDRKLLDSKQFSIDVFYEARIPVLMAIVGEDGINWYRSRLSKVLT